MSKHFPEGPGSAEAIEFQRQHSPSADLVPLELAVIEAAEALVNGSGAWVTPQPLFIALRSAIEALQAARDE